MKKKILNPRVFISYAWSSKEYENKVLAFATGLVQVGIDVVIDKWDLSEGNDTYAFMEKCVNDDTITNVLILIDPTYAQKANDHKGGVGTETQIISANVYNEVTQEKFIPILMERDSEGNILKPTYLQNRLHFDLSVPEEYDTTYTRLIKTLYGEEIYAKPQLGAKPAWVEQPIEYTVVQTVAYDVLKHETEVKVKSEKFNTFLSDISSEIIKFIHDNRTSNLDGNEYIELYDSLKPLKVKYLLLISNEVYINDGVLRIAEFFEETSNGLKERHGYGYDIAKIFLQELFLYTIALFLKKKKYDSVGEMLEKTYFNANGYRGLEADSYNMFYSGSEQRMLDKVMSAKDGQNYICGTAAYWIKNLCVEFVSKELFLLADLICFNYSIYAKDFIPGYMWFPVTYIYDNEYSSVLSVWAKKMCSRTYLSEILHMFGYETKEEFISKFEAVNKERANIKNQYRYSNSWYSAHVLGDFIQRDEIGMYK